MEIITNIVKLMDGEPRVSHRIIAEQTNNKEKSVLDLITRNIAELEEFGSLRFKIASPDTGHYNPKPAKIYYLNEPQATLLLTFMRNNEIVKAFKIRLVKEFFMMREELRRIQYIDISKLEERAKVLEISEKEFGLFKRVFYEIGITRPEELAITSNRAVAKETGVDFIKLAELKGVSTPDKYFTVTELCQKVMNSDNFSEEAKKLVLTKKGDKPRPQNLNKILETKGFQIKVDDIWKPTEKAKDLADFIQNKSKYSEKTVFHTVWKIEVLHKLF